MNSYGQINIDKLGEILKAQPDLIKVVEFKDGTKARMVNFSVFSTKEPDKFGNTIAVKVNCPKDKVRQDVNYYFGKMKEAEDKPSSKHSAQQEQQEHQEKTGQHPGAQQFDPEDLPF